MGRDDAAEIARRLAQNAEAVCRHYLSNGRREGRTWRVGDVDNTPGRSMAVRLSGPDSGPGAAGHWVDFGDGEHGDLLDVIARTCGLNAFRDVLEEARRFLSLPQPEAPVPTPRLPPAPSGSPEAARRLFASAKPILGSIAETYLRGRGIAGVRDLDCLRFHPRCYYRAHDSTPRETWPALVAAVTDLDGALTGVLRTWLARDGSGKAPLATPRRALGRLLGPGVRFGRATDVMAAGEGLETMLSLRVVLPAMPMVAALSSAHLAGLILPAGLRRVYIVRDNDRAGHRAAEALGICANADGIEYLRDAAAELYGVHTGQAWRPRTGSMVNRSTMTAAMIDSREFINARRRADAQVLLPKGTRIAFAGGVDCNDHQRIWAVLDKVLAKHSDMVLLHGGTPRGAEKIAACWADTRKISEVVFKPNWMRHAKAAPFKRNDQLLEALPIGVVVFPGSGVTDNLADKARAMGIPLFDCRKAGGA